MVLLPLLLALLLSLGDSSRVGGVVATDGAGMTFQVTPSSAADPITSKQFDVSVANAPQGPPSRLTRGRSDSMLRTSTSEPSAQSAVGGLLDGGARGHAGLDLRPVPEDAGSTPASGGWFSKLLSPSAADGALPNEYRPERPSQSLNA